MDFDFGALDKPFEADWPVTIQVPQEGGKLSPQKLMVRFKFVPEAELTAEGVGFEAQMAALRKVVVGFGKGETEKFTPELLDKMMQRPYVRAALNIGYSEFVTGLEPTKN